MEKLIKTGRFLRILDEENRISISNMAAILMMGKILTPAVSMQDIALGMTAFLPYIVKKVKGK